MNKFLPNLLLVMALGLCGLCAFQWLRECESRKRIGGLNDEVFRQKEAVQGLESRLRSYQAELARLEGVKTDLMSQVASNQQEILTLTKFSERLDNENETLREQIGFYKEAMTKANQNIEKQNEDIRKQNETVKLLVKQRDEKAAEVNKMIGEYNKVVKDFNKLTEDVAKQAQEAAAAAQGDGKKK